MPTPTPSPTGAGVSRRTLPKSKTGCRQCKKRKVKCDEEHPVCSNCRKHGVTCDFTAAVAAATPRNDTHLPSPLSSVQTPAQSPCGTAGSGFTLIDLELLHHFTTSACLAFATDPLGRSFWRVNVPQMGFGTPYILHAILSISALHLARFRSERREQYLAQAFQHHNAASAMAAPLIPRLAGGNCVELFIFSNVTTFFSLAKPIDSGDFLIMRDQAMPEWLYLLRGARALMEAGTGILGEHSALYPVLRPGIRLHGVWSTHIFESEAFRDLEDNVRTYVSHDAARCRVLLDAVDAMKRSFWIVYEGNTTDDDKVRGVLIWLYKISDEYIWLVRDRNSEALCVLAFFCVILRRLDYIWWFEGWGLYLIERIYSLLDDGYRLWVRWPIGEIGWVPG